MRWGLVEGRKLTEVGCNSTALKTLWAGKNNTLMLCLVVSTKYYWSVSLAQTATRLNSILTNVLKDWKFWVDGLRAPGLDCSWAGARREWNCAGVGANSTCWEKQCSRYTRSDGCIRLGIQSIN